MSEQMMCQKNRLGVLEMRASRKNRVRMAFCLRHKRIHYIKSARNDSSSGIAKPHAEQSGYLIIPGTTGTKLSPKFSTSPLQQSTFESSMHVFIGEHRFKRTGCHILS